MADDPTFFRARAAAEHAAAEAATLDNVRTRCERAEAAWTQMAVRAERTREQRAARDKASAPDQQTVSLLHAGSVDLSS